jgi:dTDP-4-amino-4,6-dideoxygalactose transaminase
VSAAASPTQPATSKRIPFNQPTRVGSELHYISVVMGSSQLSGGGSFTCRVQTLLEHELNVKKVLLTTSCTAALEMTAVLLKIKPEDEVIVPAFSFVSVANAFVLRGAKIVFADIRRDTLNIDEARLEQHINERTKAIVVMHYAGISCEMDRIVEIAARHSLPLVEDNAHGLFAKYKGKPLGTFGCMAAQSFHQTKNFTCGEGGALLINDSDYLDRAEIIWEKGTNRLRFLRGQVEKYSWVDLGSSYLPADLLAAFLLAQLERRDEITGRRRAVWSYYAENLHDWAADNYVALPTVPQYAENPYHLFYLILPGPAIRNRLIEHLAQRGIQTAFHYQPLHLSKMGRSFGGHEGTCPVCEEASECLLRLPFYTSLDEEAQARVVTELKRFIF